MNKLSFTSNDKIKIKSDLNEQFMTLKQQKQQLQQSTINYQMSERIVFTTNYQLVKTKNDENDFDQKLFVETEKIVEPVNILNETQTSENVEKRFSFLNSKAKSNPQNYKYLTYSSSSASKTFDKSLRNLFKYIRSYNNGSNNDNNLK